MRRTAAALNGTPVNVPDRDQLQQIVSHNRVFLRDFIMVIGALVIFVAVAMFIVLIYTLSQDAEAQQQVRQRQERAYLANLDYRTRPSTNA
uniref:Ac108 n=1 Tax=Lymantria dispar multicapsid nuclear polyhedrosis virus TaxID=10449 RepID=A0A1B1MR62_NPVLD|nr:hypothetical protein [Lymantria dispar multiple nucleopolyhedrovirus]